MSAKPMPAKGTKEIDFKAITLYQLLIEGCAKAGVLLNEKQQPPRKWSSKLDEKIRQYARLHGNPEPQRVDYHNYLRDIYNRARRYIREGVPDFPMGIELGSIAPFLIYANREEYMDLDNSINSTPVELPAITAEALFNTTPLTPVAGISSDPITVIYTPAPYSRISILRNPDYGTVNFYNNGDLLFEGDISLLIRKDTITNISKYQMYGDPQCWVKLDYQKNDKSAIAYFAEVFTESEKLKLLEPLRLLKFLEK